MYEEDMTSGMAQDENDLIQQLLLGTGASAGITAGTSGAILAERARRKSKTTGKGFRESFSETAKDVGKDIQAASRVMWGTTPYDQIEKGLKADKDSTARSPGSMRQYSQEVNPNSIYSTGRTPAGQYINNPLTQIAISARDAFSPSSEDFLGFKREDRLERGVSPEGPKSDTVISRIPILDGARDLLPEKFGGFSDVEKTHRRDIGLDLMKGNSLQSFGGIAGRTASDFVNNGARSLWWLLNAPQAVVDVASEGINGLANREGLYGLDYALEDRAKELGWINANKEPRNSHVNRVRVNMDEPALNDPQINRKLDDLRARGQHGETLYSRRRVGNNLSTLLALPGAVAINSGLGLNDVFGGAEGRKAVFPDEEDPTKTSNVLAEVAAKYILGRQGDLLPYEEYKKVRPDVSKDDYRAYKAYRFNKAEDYNIFDDGKINVGNGILKVNTDGIEGSELMFLGRSMPTDTVLMPTAAGVLGSAVGAALAKHGGFNLDGVEEGIERRETELKQLNNRYGDAQNPMNDPGIASKLRRKDQLKQEIEQVKKRRDFMTTGPQANLFTNKRLRNTGVIKAALGAGLVSMVGTSLIGNEMENRRRQSKLQERQERQSGY